MQRRLTGLELGVYFINHFYQLLVFHHIVFINTHFHNGLDLRDISYPKTGYSLFGTGISSDDDASASFHQKLTLSPQLTVQKIAGFHITLCLQSRRLKKFAHNLSTRNDPSDSFALASFTNDHIFPGFDLASFTMSVYDHTSRRRDRKPRMHISQYIDITIKVDISNRSIHISRNRI